MNRTEAIAEVKNHLEEYLQQRGINTRQNFYCLNPAHTTQQQHAGAKDMSYHRPSNRCVCHCGASYDLLDLMQMLEGAKDFNEALSMACERYGLEIDNRQESKPSPLPERRKQQQNIKQEEPGRYVNVIKRAQKNIEDRAAREYLQQRSISMQTAKEYDLGYMQTFETLVSGKLQSWQALIIPTSDNSFTARNINPAKEDERFRCKGKRSIFNANAFDGEEDVIHIVEGELDALSVIEAGGQGVALCSTANVNMFLGFLSDFKAPFSKTLILSLDNDKAGRTAQLKLLNGLLKLRQENELFKNMRVKEVNISGDFKDPNEALVANREQFIKAVKTSNSFDVSVEEYVKACAANRLEGFYQGVSESVNTPAIPTGYTYLDKELDGGLYEGLYTIPAISSLGKTTFVLQAAEAIAAQGYDVVYFSLEMAASELIAKSLSRHTFLQVTQEDIAPCHAKTCRGITDGKRYERYNDKEKELIGTAYERYASYAQHLYFHEGVGDIGVKQIRDKVELHKEITGNTPVVIIDYLQILAPYDMRATEKQNMDKAALELKRLSRDLKTPVVVISSVNRLNYHEPISMESIKESGAIEYASDVIIGLQLQGAGEKEARKDSKNWVNNQKRRNPRWIEAVVLKNRNGATGEKLTFKYYSMFNLFDEIYELDWE